jgi:hypothetical protein
MLNSNIGSILRESGPPNLPRGLRISTICYISDVSSEERERLEKNLADVEEATEQRMHSVADLIPPKSEEIHERADRVSENAEEHRRRVERRRADDDERDG